MGQGVNRSSWGILCDLKGIGEESQHQGLGAESTLATSSLLCISPCRAGGGDQTLPSEDLPSRQRSRVSNAIGLERQGAAVTAQRPGLGQEAGEIVVAMVEVLCHNWVRKRSGLRGAIWDDDCQAGGRVKAALQEIESLQLVPPSHREHLIRFGFDD